MALTSLDAVIAAPKRSLLLTKQSGQPAVSAQNWASMRAAIGMGASVGPLALSATGAGEKPDQDSAGAAHLPLAASGSNLHILSAAMYGSQVGLYVLYDRIWHNGSYTPTNGAYGTLTESGDLTEYDGEGTELWAEVATALSGTAHTLTAKVRHNDGSTSDFTATIPASAPVGRAIPFTRPAGALRSIKNVVSLTGSSAPTGSFNIVVKKPVLQFGLSSSAVGVSMDPLQTGLFAIEREACLHVDFLSNGTTAPQFGIAMMLAEG